MQRDLDQEKSPAVFQADVCVIGGGIAGLVLAQRLGNLGLDVALLEAGGPNLETRSQELYNAKMVGALHRGTTGGRYRTFGGSSTHWAGQLLPYPDETFSPRAAVGGIGWPIGPEDVRPFYSEVQKIMGVDSLSFDERFLDEVSAPSLGRHDDVRVRFSKWSPPARRNLSWTLGRDCLASERVTIYFHANASHLEFAADGGDVTGVVVKNYLGGTFRSTAKRYVVAAGALETSRLLLNSERESPARAARGQAQVGRYFFDHVTAEVAKISEKAYPLFRKYFAPYYLRKTLHTARLETSAAFQEKERILAVMAHFEFEEPEGSSLVLARRFVHDAIQGRLFRKDGPKWGDLPRVVLGAAATVYDLKVRGRRFPTPEARMCLRFDLEQKPEAGSRLFLCDEKDALGMPRLAVDWKNSGDEVRAMQAFVRPIESFAGALGIELDWFPEMLAPIEAGAWHPDDIFHPMGGARMGDSAATSVVDANLCLHGSTNCHVASTAVYPTGGSSNPTFTLMTLSLRLAAHLQQALKNSA